MDDILRIVLPLHLLAFFLIAFVWRSYLVWKRTGINPYVVGRSSARPIDFVESLYRLPAVLILVITIIYCSGTAGYLYLVPIWWLEHLAIRVAAGCFLAFALIWVVIAQIQMGSSWRIGIDSEHRTSLVKQGLFTVSRNPIFLGVRATIFGFLLISPNAFSLAAIVLADVLMQIQVRLEEQHLAAQHGEEYEKYCRQVRRWI